ncbi:MAG: sulfotransferase [Desulfobacterales bacterium]|nr:sulfotransferase [Desulfobacterales bacterium]
MSGKNDRGRCVPIRIYSVTNKDLFMAGINSHIKTKMQLLTSFLRMKPSFIIVGEAKCGTTSLYRYLNQHPDILPADVKEPGNFIQCGGSEMFCRMHYPLQLKALVRSWQGQTTLTGEATAEYFSRTEVPINIRKVVPNAKIIVMFRNPVTRAFSDYQMLNQNGIINESFETIAERSIKWLADDNLKPLIDIVRQVEHNPFRVIERGLYCTKLDYWRKHFDNRSILFIKSEDMFNRPQDIVNSVFEFLDLKPYVLKDLSIKRKGVYNSLLSREAANRLKEFYRPFNQELYNLVGRNFNWEAETEKLLSDLSV